MIGGGLEVGRVYTRVGALFDDEGFDKYDRRERTTRERARRGITTKLDTRVDTTGFGRYEHGADRVDRANTRLIRGSGRVRGALGSIFVGGIGVAAGAIGFGVLAREVHTAVDAFQESEVVGKRQALVIRSMSQDAGESAKAFDKLATAQMRRTGIDDDAIISMGNVLRTFKNVNNETGEGNRIFSRTAKAALDLSSALGTDLQSAAIQLGKAMNEPAKGAAALSRSGTVAKEDVEKLKKMAEDGVPILEQQKFLLEAVEKQVKGTAASNATATQKMKASWGEFQEWLGEKLAPTWDKAAGKARKFIDQMVAGRGAGGRFVDKLKDIWKWTKELGGKFVDAAGDVGKFFDRHPDLLKVAGTMAGIAASVKVMQKIGNLTGITGLLRLASGAASRGGILGNLAGSARPIPVFVTNPGGLPGTGPGGAPGKAGPLARGLSFAAKAAGIGTAAYLGGAAVNKFVQSIGIKTDGDNTTRGPAYVRREADTAQSDARQLRSKPMIRREIEKINEALEKNAKLEKAVGDAAPLNREGVSVYAARRKELNALLDDLQEKVPRAFKPMSKATEEAAGRVTALRTRLGHLDKGTDAYRTTARELRRAQDDLNDSLKRAEPAGRKGAKGILTIGDGAFSASGSVASAATTIASNVNNLAKSLGAKAIGFQAVAAAQAAFAGFSNLAHGGRAGASYVGRRGARGQDKRVILGPNGPEALVGDGELMVYNGDQQAALAVAVRRTFQTSMDGFFAGKWRRHSDTARYETGGLVADVRIAGPAGGLQRDAQGASDTMDRAAEARARKILNEPINRMVRFARAESAKFPGYVYGGGHGGFHGPYDCSGYVSAILHAGGLLSGGPMTTDGFKTYGEAGDGKRVTVGVRGSTGKAAHMMMHVGNTYFEAGSHGVGERGGWSGTFPIHRHPAGYELGGMVDLAAIPPELAERIRRDPSLLDPENPAYVGLGLAGGGRTAAQKKAAEKARDAKAAAASAYQRNLDHIAALARAGKIKPATVADRNIAAAKNALKGKPLTRATRLDIKGDIREARQSKREDAYQKYATEVDRINGLIRAGKLGPNEGRNKLIAAANKALAGGFGKLTARDRTTVQGDLREARVTPEPSVLTAKDQKRLDAITTRIARADVDTPFDADAPDPTALADDVKAAADLRDFWQGIYDDAVKRKRPKTVIAQIAGNLSSARSTLAGLWQTYTTPAGEAPALTDAEQAELDDLTGLVAQADVDTPFDADKPVASALDDDIAAADKVTGFWQRIYDAAKAAGRPNTILGAIASSLSGARSAAAGLRSSQSTGANAAANSADAQAITEQIKAQNVALRRTNQVQAAAIGVFGSGGDLGTGMFGSAFAGAQGVPAGQAPPAGHSVTFQSVFPPTPEQARQAAAAVGEGFAAQGAPQSPRVQSPY